MAGLRGFFEADVKIPFCKFYVVDRKLCTANVRYFSPIVAQYIEHEGVAISDGNCFALRLFN